VMREIAQLDASLSAVYKCENALRLRFALHRRYVV